MQTIYSNLDPLSSTNAENPNEAPTVVAKKLLMLIPFFVIIMGGILYALSTRGRYIDYSIRCNIKINGDLLKGNTNTIYEAINKIKTENAGNYKTLCANINSINESFCIYAEKDDSILAVKNTDGCLIKNTGIIYLTPDGNGDNETISKRAEALVKYSKKAIN